jgi:hypothetical protein
MTSLRRVLAVFAARHPLIGYCQSMNYVAGFLLLFFREQEAFWMFCSVMGALRHRGFSYGTQPCVFCAQILFCRWTITRTT